MPASAQYSVDKSFADRRLKVKSARTYFYLNEATCERNMEIFIKCLEAVSGNYRIGESIYYLPPAPSRFCDHIDLMSFCCFSGATFGTGITAIKLTALGRPQLLVSARLSEQKIRFFLC